MRTFEEFEEKAWVYNQDEANKWARENSSAGYIQPHIRLSRDDIDKLLQGMTLVLSGEYATSIEAYNENSLA